MLTHLPPLVSYNSVYGNGLSVDSANLNILYFLAEESRLYSLKLEQVLPKVYGFQCRKYSTHTPFLWAFFLEACTTSYVRDHTDSTRGGATIIFLYPALNFCVYIFTFKIEF